MSIKHGSDDIEKTDSIVVKDIKNVWVGVKTMNYIKCEVLAVVAVKSMAGCGVMSLVWCVETVGQSTWCYIPDSTDLKELFTSIS